MATATKFVLEKDKQVIEKDPNAVLDYIWPWGDWLDAVGDTISTIQVTSSGVTVNSSGVSGKNVVVWVAGGTPSKTSLASVTVQIRTVGGRKDDRTAYFRITER